MTVPTSLLAHITVTRATSAGSRSIASRSASRSTRPYASTGSQLDLGALVLGEPVHGVEDGVVLDGAGQHAVRRGVGVPAGPVEPLDREVVGLGAAGGEDDLAGRAPSAGGERLAGLLDDPAGPAAAACSEEALPVTASWAVIACTASGSIGVVAAWSR